VNDSYPDYRRIENTMKKRIILKTISLAFLTTLLAENYATASTQLRIGNIAYVNHTANAANRSTRRGIDRSIGSALSRNLDFGGGKGVIAADPVGNEWSFFTDYTFINTEDQRVGLPSGDTQSVAVGADVFLPSEILVGLIYSYSDTDLDGGPFSTQSNSHFLTAYASKSIQPWLQVGVTVGVGDTDTDTIVPGAADVNVENGTWTTSPFVSLLYSNGPVFASSTLAYQMTQVGGSGQHAFSLETNVGYALTDSLSVVGLVRYYQVMNSEIDPNDDDNYTVLGTKVYYSFPGGASLFGGVEFDVWNDSYDTFTAVTGYSRPF